MADNYFNIAIVKRLVNFDLSRFIDKNSVSISAEPRMTATVRTMDGVDHVSGGGIRQTIRFTFNPMTAENAKTVVSELLESPALGITFNGMVPPSNGAFYEMRLSEASAEYLAQCKFVQANWFQFEEIELVEL